MKKDIDYIINNKNEFAKHYIEVNDIYLTIDEDLER